MMMEGYDSPVKLTYVDEIKNQLSKQVEGEIYRTVTKVGIMVDKDELIKALKYDREQYEAGYAKGYEDGQRDYSRELAVIRALENLQETKK